MVASVIDRSIDRSDLRSSDIPVLIAYFGEAPDYLRLALRSAADFNRHIVMLGDHTNREFWPNHWDSSESDLSKFEDFKRTFIKMSDYGDRYEMAFWKRPFAVEEWMRRARVDRVFLLDSDVVTFADYTAEVVPMLPPGCLAALMTQEDQDELDLATSLHFSYWTLDALSDFTSFCIEAYRNQKLRSQLEEKYRWHTEGRRPGGICEMTLLHLWRGQNGGPVSNLARVTNGMTGDGAVGGAKNCVADEYRMRLGFKKFAFRDGLPFGFNKVLGREVRFLCIHCQGGSKSLMKLLCDSPWRRFYGEAYHVRRLYREAYRLPQRLSALIR